MGIIITPQVDIAEYFESDAISQSRLKTVQSGLAGFIKDQEKSDKDLYYSEKESFVKGSAVDIQLTGNEEDFDNEHYISALETKPSDVEMRIIHRVFDEIIDGGGDVRIMSGLVDYGGFLMSAIQEEGWYKGKPGEVRIAGLIERCSSYFRELKASFGKQILTLEENNIINDVVNSFRTHPNTKDFFDRDAQQGTANVDIYYQLPIYFEYKGRACKALLDMLIVYKDDSNQITSVLPIDVKTMSGPTITFHNNLKMFRYDVQAAWYTLAIESWLEQQQDQNMFPIIMSFKFVVESVTSVGNPLQFVVDETLLDVGRNGRPELINSVATRSDDFDTAKLYDITYREVKGFEQLFDEYTYYQDNGIDMDTRLVDTNGILSLDWNGIMECN